MSRQEVVLVTDAGGRGDVLAEAYANSPHVATVFVAPGNDMNPLHKNAPVERVPHVGLKDPQAMVEFCIKHGITLVDVCQDNAVAAGFGNALDVAGIPYIGPTREAGMIESDKKFSRVLGTENNVAQPRYFEATTMNEGVEYFLNELGGEKAFVKFLYLIGGKGAIGGEGIDEVKAAITLVQKMGGDGKYLIEEWLEGDDGSSGEEVSIFTISDGKSRQYLGAAQDHKRAFDGDLGENTGGMGAVSTPLIISDKFLRESYAQVIDRTLRGLQDRRTPYKGVQYASIMAVMRNGVLRQYKIEDNARWGDPEAQVIIPAIKNDFLELGHVVANGSLAHIDIARDQIVRVAVAGVSKGYPGKHDQVKGKRIKGLDEARKIRGVRLYGAGVKIIDGVPYADGGRLFYIVGEGKDVNQARNNAYAAMEHISVEGDGLHYRTDIGHKDVNRLIQAA